MKLSRRSFIKSSGLAIAGASIASPLFSFAKSKGVLGIQLYSVREDMGKDALGTLKQIAAIGYKNVEHANYKERNFMAMHQLNLKRY